MGLNIKNEETCTLIRELASVTGETMTHAVTVAVRERLEREQTTRRRLRAEEMLAIGERIRARLKEPAHSLDHAHLFYDDAGQFK